MTQHSSGGRAHTEAPPPRDVDPAGTPTQHAGTEVDRYKKLSVSPLFKAVQIISS